MSINRKNITNLKKPTFIEGVIVALIASVIGSVGYFALTGIVSGGFAIRLLVSGFTLGYILYLLSRSKERVGRVTTILIWLVATVGLWLIWPGIITFVMLHLLMIWLARSLYFYSSLFSSLADLVLHGFAIASAIWALSYTSSLFLGIWCFFLVQAVFVFIPRRNKNKSAKNQSATPTEDSNNDVNFQRAYRDAEAAVRKLSTH